MPRQIKKLSDTFKMFYLNRHSGKKIEYQMDKGEADIAVRFGDGTSKSTTRLLVVSTFQMVVLLMYNEKLEFTFQVIDRFSILIHSHVLYH